MSWRFWLRLIVCVCVVAIAVGSLIVVRELSTRRDDGGMPADIWARMQYMEEVARVATVICREPPAKTRDARISALRAEHRAFRIECSDQSVSVSLAP